MDVRTFRAATLPAALAQVRQELGPKAAVLHTRELTGGWFGWLPGRPRFEVVASNDFEVPSRLAPRPSEPRPAPTVPPTASEPAPAKQAFREEIRGQLSELQTLVEQLCRRNRAQSGHADLPDGLFRLYTDLIEAELQEEIVRELVECVRQSIPAGDLDDLSMLKARVSRLIEGEFACQGPFRLTPGRCHLAALVGPTGVGKTTTIAKLAANYRLRERKKVGLITVDTYRIAAVEQLRTYADIIDLPMHVVSTPREMRAAVRSLADLDLVLIDTAGRSPRDEVKIQELKSYLTEAQADEVHLVLSAVTSSSTLTRTAEAFADVGSSALLVTKLDEAASLGSLLPLVRACRLPLSYVTHGQNVPDDIAVADGGALARMMLGQAPLAAT